MRPKIINEVHVYSIVKIKYDKEPLEDEMY